MEELNERIAKLETTVQEHSKLHEKQNEKNDILVEMKTILRLQTDINAETKEQMKDFGLTLNKVNENLSALNVNQQQMKMDMSEIGSRVSDIERHQEDAKIDTSIFFKGFFKHLCTAAFSILVAYIIYKFGISTIHNR